MKKPPLLVSVLLGSLFLTSVAIAAPAKKSKKSAVPSNAALAEPPPLTEATPVEHVVPGPETSREGENMPQKSKFFEGNLLALFPKMSVFNEGIRDVNTTAAAAGYSGKIDEIKNAWGARLRFGLQLIEDFPIFAVFGATVASATKETKMTSGASTFDGEAETSMLMPTVGIRHFFLKQNFEAYGSGEIGFAFASTRFEGPNSTWPYNNETKAGGIGLAMGVELGVNIPVVSDVKLNVNGGYQYARVSTLKVTNSTGSNTLPKDTTLTTAAGKKLQLDYSGPYVGVGIYVPF